MVDKKIWYRTTGGIIVDVILKGGTTYYLTRNDDGHTELVLPEEVTKIFG